MTPTASAPPARLTAEEFVARYDNANVELIDGVVRLAHEAWTEPTAGVLPELPMPNARHGQLCSVIGHHLRDFAEKNDLGHVATNDTFVRTKRDPDSVLGADVLFISYARQPRGPLPDSFLPEPPELVVEVRSPTDRWRALVNKAYEYLDAGVLVVVLVDPRSASVTAVRREEIHQVFHNGDELTIPDVLPGFALPLAKLFA